MLIFIHAMISMSAAADSQAVAVVNTVVIVLGHILVIATQATRWSRIFTAKILMNAPRAVQITAARNVKTALVALTVNAALDGL